MVDFDTLLARIYKAARVDQDVDLAKFLSITPQAVNSAKKKKHIPRTWFAIVEKKSGITKEELCETPEEGRTRITKVAAGNQESDISASEMLIMTSVILESNTVYRSALASNIRAFYQAVKGEQEVNELREEIKKMREEFAELKDIMLAQGYTEKKRAGNDI